MISHTLFQAPSLWFSRFFKESRVLVGAMSWFLCSTSGFAVTPSKTADQTPEGLSKTDWSSIRAAYEAGRHAFQPVEGGWQARNPGQQWTTRFDAQGFEAKPASAAWSWGLQLQGYGWGEQVQQITGSPAVQAQGQRLSYQWDAVMQEWWVNDQRGLEHGYTLAQRPAEVAPGAALVLSIGVRGSLSPRVAADAQGVLFQDTAGATVLNYTGLKVWDAEGKVLASRFETSGKNSLRLIVEDKTARYPITIDPIAQQAYLKPAAVGNTQAGDGFGYSVAVSGDTVVVGAIFEDSSTTGINSTPNEDAMDAGAAYVFVRSGGTWSQQAYLKASQVNASDFFGISVAVSGDTVVVGAWLEDSSTTGINSMPNESASQAGAAYVFVRSGTTWSQQAYLKASQVNEYDIFGAVVAVSGDTVVVGAGGEDTSTTGINSIANENATDAGAAYVFVRSGGTWSQQAYLKAHLVTSGDRFGNSVAVSGDTVVVGAGGEDSSTTGINSNANENATDAGAAYVFVRSGTTWSQQAYLKAHQVTSGDRFGLPAAVSGDTIVIGADGEDSSTTGINSTPNEGATDSGAAYIFVRSGTTWSQQAYLKASQVTANDFFGISVAVSGETVIVGACYEDSGTNGINSMPNESATDSGAAYVFARSGGVWAQQAYLKANNTSAGDSFGFSVALSGDKGIVGAHHESSNTTGVNSIPNRLGLEAGAAYMFDGFNPSPVVNALSPINGPTGGGTTLTLSGTAFTGATTVTIAGVAATAVNVLSDTTLICVTPPGTVGAASVQVTTAAGTSTSNSLFSYITPEMSILGNGVDIANGDTSPNNADHSDFGKVVTEDYSLVRTFTIQNTGQGELLLTGSPKVVLSGPHAADFSVITQPVSPVTAGGSTIFQITFNPSGGGLRSASVSVTNNDAGDTPYNFLIEGIGIGFEPTISAAVTMEDAQTGNGLVFAANIADDNLTTHYKITAITSGSLYHSDGLRGISEGDFITLAEGMAGLKFTPAANANSANVSEISFSAQAAIGATDVAVRGGVVKRLISVVPVANAPSISPAATYLDTQTGGGLVISRNVVDGPEVTHFKVTGITNGSLFQNNGTTAILNGDFITYAQGSAGLKFTPSYGFIGNASFSIQAATSVTGDGLSPVVATTIPVASVPAPTLLSTAPLMLNTSNGLLENTVRLTNSSSVTLGGFRLTINNLPASFRFWNRTHATLPIADIYQLIPAGGYVDFKVQIYGVLGSLSWTPSYTIETIGSIALDPLAKVVPAPSSSYAININTMGIWSVQESIPWVSVSPMNGSGPGVITVNVSTQTTTVTRAASFNIGNVTHNITQMGILKPVLGELAPQYSFMVSQPVSITIPTNNWPITSYKATNLPAGLIVNAATGVISGKPTRAGRYAVSIYASNIAGVSNTIRTIIEVTPLTASLIGTYHGYVSRSGGVYVSTVANLGARFEFVVSATGGVSGKVIEGVTSKGFTGALSANINTPNEASFVANVPTTALGLNLGIDASTQTMSGDLSNATAAAPVVAWRNGWSAARPATAYAARHNFIFSRGLFAATPDGVGFGSFSVTASTGALVVSGKTPDGGNFSTTTFIGPNGQVLIYWPLYTNKGSILGQLTVAANAAALADNTTSGEMTWMKPVVSADLLYPAGFGPLAYTIEGGAYIPPVAGQRIMELPLVTTPATNSVFAFELGALGLPFEVNARVTAPATLAFSSVNPNRVAATAVSTSGHFNGSFVILGATTALNRTAAFSGVIIPTVSGLEGWGYFILPQVPISPQTVITAPKLSGQVRFTRSGG